MVDFNVNLSKIRVTWVGSFSCFDWCRKDYPDCEWPLLVANLLKKDVAESSSCLLLSRPCLELSCSGTDAVPVADIRTSISWLLFQNRDEQLSLDFQCQTRSAKAHSLADWETTCPLPRIKWKRAIVGLIQMLRYCHFKDQLNTRFSQLSDVSLLLLPI